MALFKDITQEVKSLNNIYIAEIKDVSQLADSTIQKEFTQALCLSPIVSLTLDRVATGLVTQLLEQVPSTLERLTIFCEDPAKGHYPLPICTYTKPEMSAFA